ncbi:MAG: hypothetical protein KDE54_02495, partial [Caldilineaceae bacterium]|nr:hypothetical protein [Caldilineaceae bacterium]
DLRAYNLNSPSNYIWTLGTSDTSGATGISFFDFNGDSIKEIVYRDETRLRILYGGPIAYKPTQVSGADRNYTTFACGSGTGWDNPTIADIDNDNEAEIAVACNNQICAYESASEPWQPARPIWNQVSGYHVLNINDDGTVPIVEQSPLVEFPAGSGNYPFNIFQGQVSPTDLLAEVQFCDLGDAPASYGTLLADDGAYHTGDNGLFLGAALDTEIDGHPSAAANGDDLTGDTPDDEDGVTLSTLYAGATATISVTVSEPTGVDGMLQGWFDWNGDGDWDDAGEQVLTDQAVVNGANTFAVDILPASGVYTTYARFRLSSSSGITMAGVADDGEVEDYFVTFDFLQDFGDAPDSYLTTLAANGPRHILSNPADNPVRLGAAVTAESDANTPLDATGDASDDGVASFPTLLTTDTSYTLAVNVTNSSGSAGNLIGWIDFNGNGVFEAGEAAVTTVPDGTNGGT